MASFVSIAPYYDTLMSNVPYQMWMSYLKLVWANIDEKPQSVLEVCCGTGTMCRILAREGYSVAGIDLSPQMIDEARRLAELEALNIPYFVQDAAELSIPSRFDAAFSFFDSINYITDPARCRMAIGRVAEHLKPGASFVFDINTPFAFEQRMFDQKNLSERAPVRYNWKSRYDPFSRICTVDMEFWVAGGYYTETHMQRAHSMDEIEDWMKQAGFERIRFYDAYTLDPPHKTSDRIHALGILPDTENNER